jgi:DNA-binding helix-hairpin-helix protein with protein kinase domain
MTKLSLWQRISNWVQGNSGEVVIYDGNLERHFVGSKLAEGGQGAIYALNTDPELLYKEYFAPTPENERKIGELIKLSKLPGHEVIALPISPVYMKRNTLRQWHFTGFLMPNVKDADLLFSYMHPEEREQRHPHITTKHIYVIAHNIAYAMEKIHAWRHTVIGDVNESNILVRNNLHVTFVDADSVQYTNGRVYRCEVGKHEYVPPEGRNAGGVISQEHDLFALAVLIFQLLMWNQYPFKGRMKINIDKPQLGLYLKDKGVFPYIDNPVAGPPAKSMPYEWLEPEIRGAFKRTFISAFKAPSKRVTAYEWRKLLQKCIERQQTCPQHPTYQYGYHLKKCPWCNWP